MDLDREKRRQAIHVIISDSLIAFFVVVIVVVLLAIVIGYRINSDFSLEQNGLVQLQTVPSDATVIIDGETELGHTKLSKMLPGGEHEVVLQRDGYEEWRKTITVTPGWLLRVEYPRLIKQDRETRDMIEFGERDLDFFYASPSRKYALYSLDHSTEWHFVSGFGNNNLKDSVIDITGIFSTEVEVVKDNTKVVEGEEVKVDETPEYLFTGKIKSIEWNDLETAVLLKVSDGENEEWGVIDFANPTESVNLSSELTRYESNYKNLDDKEPRSEKNTGSAATVKQAAVATKKIKANQISDARFETTDKIFVVVNGNLREISLTKKTAMSTEINDIAEFENYEDQVVYVTTKKNGACEIRLYRMGDEKSVLVQEVGAEKSSVLVSVTKYGGQSYLEYFIDNRLYVYRSVEFPHQGQKISLMVKIAENDTSITPSGRLAVSPNGMVVIARDGNKLASFENEMEQLSEYEYGSSRMVWFDPYILADVTEKGELMIRDFDGANLRKLSVKGAAAGYDQFVAPNNKCFYYIVRNADDELSLRRESL